MIDDLAAVCASDKRIAYALLFGSSARATTHVHSDVDIAIDGAYQWDLIELGDLKCRLEAAAGRPVDLILLEEAPPGLAYRVFRDGRAIIVRDEQALHARLARAILEYLDFRPLEQLCAQGVLAAAHGR